jgi:predicted GNAT family N-acyltransferase
MKIKKITLSDSDYLSAKELRAEVLRKPLGLPANDPAFSDNSSDFHFVAKQEDDVVGIVVLVPNYKPGTGKLRQMATAEEVRGKGFGVELVEALEQEAARLGMNKIVLHSRHYAVGFYEKLGYQITSDVFQEVGMDHYVMEKSI